MAEAGVFHGLRGPVACRGDNLEHRAVGRLDEVVAVVLEIDDEIEMVHVPLRQVSGVWRRNTSVFQSFEHDEDCSRTGDSLAPQRKLKLDAFRFLQRGQDAGKIRGGGAALWPQHAHQALGWYARTFFEA